LRAPFSVGTLVAGTDGAYSHGMEPLMNMLRGAIDQIVSFLPAFFAGLVVLAIGWIVAWAVSRLIRVVLPRIGFDRFLARHKLTNRAPEKHPGSNAVAQGAKWIIMLIALMQAANIWGLGIVASGLAAAIRYLPNVVAAVLIFGAAFVVGNWARDRLRSSPAEARYSGAMLPAGVRAGILTIGAFVALRQLAIAPEILIIGFTLVFGAIAVAMALAFGLGGRRAAERMTEDWYERQRPRQPVSGAGEPSYRYREPPPERPGIH
jgi:hypothetical protein